MTGKFYIETYGCQMNSYDSQAIEGILEGLGMTPVLKPEAADLIIFNTCSVRDAAEQRVIGRINQLDGLRRGRKGRLLMGVAGCMSQRMGEELIAVTKRRLDFVVGPDQYNNLPEILARIEAEERDLCYRDFDQEVAYFAKPKDTPPGGTHFVAVMRGCDKFCTYCIVPFTRGRERSRDRRSIVEEVERLAARGAFEVMLLGQAVSSYCDDDLDFAGLLGEVSAVEGIESVRFMTSYPTDMDIGFFRAVASLPKVGTGIHLPFQSGSDKILKAMNRRYTIGEYERILENGRREVPGLLFSTDIIVGFPGETEEDFQATLAVVERQAFISAYMFKYSPREGTLSARWEDDIPTAVKEERLGRLIALQERMSRRQLDRCLGQEMEILLDEPSKKLETQLRGRTRSNVRVIIDKDPDLKIGSKVMVRVTEIKGTSLLAVRVQGD
ncbi:MAG: tRNA (N6-isopentenyl adenosine(37)-C2)-methylthiotransferase MiaB [bacterium]|nr:tRNA (N6-isopentenyl adenosine(37)-C2)-methylthiotransferase MiaB [bacterium]